MARPATRACWPRSAATCRSRFSTRPAALQVDWKPQRGNRSLASPLGLARQCLVVAGVPANRVMNLAPVHVAKLAMGADPRQMGLGAFYASDGPGYNVSGMFSNILLDAANVSLRRSFDDARTTYQMWMKRGPDVPDFKLVNKVIAGELGDPRPCPKTARSKRPRSPTAR
jgi:hypothetical protein